MILVAMPIWFFLLYQILVRVEANTQMWVAYWVYVPVMIMVQSISSIHKVLNDE